jgi:hypothetical protein
VNCRHPAPSGGRFQGLVTSGARPFALECPLPPQATAFQLVMAKVREVDELVTQVASASKEQSEGVS